MNAMTTDQANAVYDVLVEHAGAPDSEDDRSQFVYHQTAERCREYRFMGSLGFGGKFYVDPNRWRVSTYPESMTAARAATIEATNGALASLRAAIENLTEEN